MNLSPSTLFPCPLSEEFGCQAGVLQANFSWCCCSGQCGRASDDNWTPLGLPGLCKTALQLTHSQALPLGRRNIVLKPELRCLTPLLKTWGHFSGLFFFFFFPAFPQYIVRGGYVYGSYCFQVVKIDVILFMVSTVCLPFPFVFPSSSLTALITIISMTILFQKYPLITRYGIKSEAG